METFSALLALCTGNSPVTGEFPAQRPVTRNFDVFFDLRPNKQLSKNGEAGDLRRCRAHYDVIVMINSKLSLCQQLSVLCFGLSMNHLPPIWWLLDLWFLNDSWSLSVV